METLANIPETLETCPNCHEVMLTGELVQTDWAGDPIAHINCPKEEKQ